MIGKDIGKIFKSSWGFKKKDRSKKKRKLTAKYSSVRLFWGEFVINYLSQKSKFRDKSQSCLAIYRIPWFL